MVAAEQLCAAMHRPLSRYAKTIPCAFLAGAVGAILAYLISPWFAVLSVAGFGAAISEAVDRNIIIAMEEGRVR